MSIVHSIVLAVPAPRHRGEVRALLDGDPRVRVLAATGSRQTAAELLAALEPDAAVIDLALLAGCEYPLHGWGPVSRDVALVAIGHGENQHIAAALRNAGFAAYVPSARLPEELADAVVTACRAPAGMPS